jgi:hypothetical protein
MDVPGWDNKRIEREGGAAYLEAQRKLREEDERERKAAEEESDFQRFAKMYEERGGDPSQARAMYSKYRSDLALEETKRLDHAARARQRIERNRAV